MTSGIMRAIIGIPLGVLTAFVGLQTLKPTPTAYLKIECSGGKYDRNPPIDPKAEIIFGNVGCRPMYMHKLSLKSGGKEVTNLSTLFQEDKRFCVTSESTNLVKKLDSPKAWQPKGRVAYLTARPIDPDDHQWYKDLSKKLKLNNIEFELEVSAARGGILHYLTKETISVKVVS
jgi:hypothetical protein